MNRNNLYLHLGKRLKEVNIGKLFLIGLMLAVFLIPAAAVAEDGITIHLHDGRHMAIPYRDISRIEFRTSGQAGVPFGFGQGISVAGLWKTNQGDIQLSQTGTQVTGSYNPAEHGELVGNMSGNTLTGLWIEDASGSKCSSPRNGRFYWGKIRFVFDGNRFTGQWGYCDAEPNQSWTESR